MKHRNKILIASVVLVVLVVFFFARAMVNPILERTLSTYLKEKLEVKWVTPSYHFTYEDLDIDILARRITFTNFRMVPLDEFREAFFRGVTPEKVLREIRADAITVQGVGLMNFLWDKDIEIDQIDVGAVSLDLLVSPRSKIPKEAIEGSIGTALEGIRLPGIKKLALGRFALGSFDMHQIRMGSGDTLITFHSSGGSIDGLAVKRAQEDENSYFEPDLKDMVLKLDPQTLNLKQDLYQMVFQELEYTYASEDLLIRDITFTPREARAAFREKATFSYEIYDARVRQLLLEDFDLERYLYQGVVSIEKMALDSLELEIFRDKTKPFNTARKVLLLNQKMEALDFPLHIGAIEVRNSYLKYTEQSSLSADPLVVDFSDLSVDLAYLSSVPDSLAASKPLTVELSAKLDRAVPIGIKLEMPYQHNTFHLSGHTEGAASFASFNKTVLPAIGLKFTSGRLDGLDFKMTGTPWKINGTLTLRYHDLKVELDNPDHSKRKTLSWAANALLKGANPNKHGKTIVGIVEFDRVPYKGLGNFAWKGVQSGLVNSVSPFGKHIVVKSNK